VDEEGCYNDITYFRIGNTSVTMYDNSFLIESEIEDEISKVLQYINKAIS
jgi:hypothetical protein